MQAHPELAERLQNLPQLIQMLNNGEDIRELWDGLMDGLVGGALGGNANQEHEQEREGDVDDVPNQMPGGIDEDEDGPAAQGEDEQEGIEEEEEEEEESAEVRVIRLHPLLYSSTYSLATSAFFLTKPLWSIL